MLTLNRERTRESEDYGFENEDRRVAEPRYVRYDERGNGYSDARLPARSDVRVEERENNRYAERYDDSGSSRARLARERYELEVLDRPAAFENRADTTERSSESGYLWDRLNYSAPRRDNYQRTFYNYEERYDDKAESPPFRLSDTPRFEKEERYYDAPTKNIKKSRFSLKERFSKMSKKSLVILAVYVLVAVVVLTLIIVNAALAVPSAGEVNASGSSAEQGTVDDGRPKLLESDYDYETESSWFDKLCEGTSDFFGN